MKVHCPFCGGEPNGCFACIADPTLTEHGSHQKQQESDSATTGEATSFPLLLQALSGPLSRIATSLEQIQLLVEQSCKGVRGVLGEKGGTSQARKIDSQKTDASAALPEKPERKGKSKLPLTYLEDSPEWRAKWGIPEVHPNLADFTDYWLSEGRQKVDWSRCWKRWVRNQGIFGRQGNGPRVDPNAEKPDWLTKAIANQKKG